MMRTVRQINEPASAVQERPESSTALEGRRPGSTDLKVRRTDRTLRWPARLAAMSSATLMVGALAVVMAQSATPVPQASKGEVAETSSPSPATEAAKTLTSAGGSIEGYLAGGRWR